MKYDFTMFFVIIFTISFCILFGVMLYQIHQHDEQFKYKFNPNDFTSMAHYVKFHIHPDGEGIGVAAWASDDFPPTTGYTDNNSEVTFPMIPTAKYNMLIDSNRCSYYIYPSVSYYEIWC